jgi:hypothetical protein
LIGGREKPWLKSETKKDVEHVGPFKSPLQHKVCSSSRAKATPTHWTSQNKAFSNAHPEAHATAANQTKQPNMW